MHELEIPLKTWSLYFPDEEYTAFNKEISLIIDIRKALSYPPDFYKSILDSGVFECEYSFFSLFTPLATVPVILNCFSCAVSERIFEIFNTLIIVETRIINYMETLNFSEITTSRVDTLVSIIGSCSRVGFRKIENLETYFECIKCSKILKVKNQNNIYRVPKCICKGKTVIFLTNHPKNKCTDKQEIKLQEVFSSGSNACVIDVDVYGNLVGSIAPGDLVQLTGIVRAELGGEGYRLKIQCNNLQIIKNRANFRMENYFQTDFEIFKKISEESNIISLFIKGIYAEIYGNALIKAGLVLSLFGGTKKFTGAQSIRSEIHVLIIGDPGLGKSRLLLNTCNVIPRSTYVSGNFCTTAGLTVSISHDPVSGEYMTDAGALVVSDGGMCCIDEFDKIDNHTALYEAMEDQQVTVAKGGVFCSVPARATIIAASNPKGGHFEQNKTLGENLSFDMSLLSRFDLVFVLRDDLNEKENYEIGNQILKRRQDEMTQLVADLRGDELIGTNMAVYSPEVLKKYIEYAKVAVNPVLNKGAKQKIKEYYLELRGKHKASTRTLESLMRLTESCARMELKPVASAVHALFAINLHKKTWITEEKKGKSGIEGLLRDFMKTNGSLISKGELEEIIRRSNAKKSEGEVIEMLNRSGTIIKKGPKEYKINV